MTNNLLTTVLLSAYKKDIEKMAAKRISDIFYNSSDAHASIVINALTRNANSSIKILCQDMCSPISNSADYLCLLEDFLKKGTSRKLEVIHARHSSEFHKLPIAKLLANYALQVSVKKLKEGAITYKSSPVNFTVADGRAYRIETDIAKKTAFGSFNSPEKAIILSDVFDDYFRSTSVETIPLVYSY